VRMGGLLGIGAANMLADLLSPLSLTTYVFLTLLTIVICFIVIPDIATEWAYPLLVIFTILAIGPDREGEM